MSKYWYRVMGFVLILAVIVAIAPAGLSLAQSGNSNGNGNGNTNGNGNASSSSEATINVATDPNLGKILVDGKGMTLYVFDKDTSDQSNCTGQCLQIWLPLLTQGNPTVGQGVDSTLIGNTKLADGTMVVTYNHHPLYRYSKDINPGDVNGQGVGEVWWTIGPDGNKIQTSSSNSNSNANTNANANSNANTNANSNTNGNANTNANANSNANTNANSNTNGNANTNANANSNANTNANSNTNTNANANSNANTNANSNTNGNANTNANGNGLANTGNGNNVVTSAARYAEVIAVDPACKINPDSHNCQRLLNSTGKIRPSARVSHQEIRNLVGNGTLPAACLVNLAGANCQGMLFNVVNRTTNANGNSNKNGNP